MNQQMYKTFGYKTIGFFVIWLLVSESYHLGHMALGLLASFGVALLNTRRDAPTGPSVRWAAALTFAPWLFTRILVSGLHLSYLILHPRLPIAPRMMHYQTRLDTDTAIVLLGNSITLTPGTITVEVNGKELQVHALDEESTRDLAGGRLEERVSGVFRAGGGRS